MPKLILKTEDRDDLEYILQMIGDWLEDTGSDTVISAQLLEDYERSYDGD